MKKILMICVLVVFAGCATREDHWIAPMTPSRYYDSLKKCQKPFYAHGFGDGQNQAMQQMHDAYMNSLRSVYYSGRKTAYSLDSRLEQIPIPGYQDADGVIHESSRRFIEINSKE